MAATRSRLLTKSWSKDKYIISTDPSWIPIGQLNDFFSSPDMYWAKPMPEEAISEMIANSLCFGLYEIKSATSNAETREFIGFARCVTDFTTLLYLTDVYTISRIRGSGLGRWMIECVKEVMDGMPHVRRIVFVTSNWERSVPFYEKVLGATVMQSRPPQTGGDGGDVAVMSRTGPGWPEH